MSISEKVKLFLIFPGNVFIFRSFNDFKEGKLRCDQTLYLFAFVITIVTYALLFVLCCACVSDKEECNDVPVWMKRKARRSQSVWLVDFMTSMF